MRVGDGKGRSGGRWVGGIRREVRGGEKTFCRQKLVSGESVSKEGKNGTLLVIGL